MGVGFAAPVIRYKSTEQREHGKHDRRTVMARLLRSVSSGFVPLTLTVEK